MTMTGYYKRKGPGLSSVYKCSMHKLGGFAVSNWFVLQCFGLGFDVMLKPEKTKWAYDAAGPKRMRFSPALFRRTSLDRRISAGLAIECVLSYS